MTTCLKRKCSYLLPLQHPPFKNVAQIPCHCVRWIEHRSTAGRERSPFELISRLLLFKYWGHSSAYRLPRINQLVFETGPYWFRGFTIPLVIQLNGQMGDTCEVLTPTCIRIWWLNIPLTISIGRQVKLCWSHIIQSFHMHLSSECQELSHSQ